MSGVVSTDDLRTMFGDFYHKLWYGLIINTTAFDLKVLPLGTSHNNGPMYRPKTKKVNCVGLAKEGRSVQYNPACGVIYLPPGIQYQVPEGVYGDLTITRPILVYGNMAG
jgi:hypothetical protein